MSRLSSIARAAGLAALAFAAVFLAGLVLARVAGVHDALTPEDLDHRVAARVAASRGDHPDLTATFRTLTRLGDPEVGIGLTVVIGLGLLGLGWRGVGGLTRGDAGFFVAVVAASSGLVNGLKVLIARERPPPEVRLVVETSYSFPSGHALSSTALLTALAWIGVRVARACGAPPWVAPAWAGSCLVLAALIAASRVWLGVHYFSDVAGGFVLGIAWTLAAGWAWSIGRSRDERSTTRTAP